MKKILQTLLPFILILHVFACDDGDTDTPSQNIIDLVTSDDNFETLARAVQTSGLVDTLSGPGPFTVFAPTDEAFALLPDGLLDSLDAGTLSTILQYHVIAGSVPASQAVTLTAADSVEGSTIGLSVTGSDLFLNGLTKVTSTDIEVDNGIIHVIDSVILPIDFPGDTAQAVSAYPRLSSLLEAATNADAAIIDTLTGTGPLTLFAPINSAFSGVDTTSNLTDVLLYHVLSGTAADSTAVTGFVGTDVETASGDSVAVVTGPALEDGQGNTRNLVSVDLRTSNGIIHAIDGILFAN